MAFPDYIPAIEAKIAGRLVRQAIKLGYSLSVYDGEEWTVKKSRDYAAITAALGTTDCDVLRIRQDTGNALGSITLIWGNDEDVISDCSDIPDIRSLCDYANN
jgi:hypothetical protein